MYPELLSVGFITIHTYGICILLGFLAAMYALYTKSKRDNLNLKFLYDHIFSLIIVPLVLSRLVHVVFNWKLYRTNLPEILYFWKGGYSLWIVIIGLILTTLFLATRYNQSFNRWLDQISIAFFIFLAFGMVGYTMSQYGLSGIALGTPTVLPWGITMNTMDSPFGGVAVHPVLLYQALLALVLGVLGYVLHLKPGRFWTFGWTIFALFGFFIEFLKWEQRYILFNINGNQVFVLLLVLLCSIGLIITIRKGSVEHSEVA